MPLWVWTQAQEVLHCTMKETVMLRILNNEFNAAMNKVAQGKTLVRDSDEGRLVEMFIRERANSSVALGYRVGSHLTPFKRTRKSSWIGSARLMCA